MICVGILARYGCDLDIIVKFITIEAITIQDLLFMNFKHFQNRQQFVDMSQSESIKLFENMQHNVFLKKIIQMHRNIELSKQTEDRVKLAKQYIQSKYRTILQKEQERRIGWDRIMQALSSIPISKQEKKIVVEKALNRQYSHIRQMRTKDKLSNYELLGMIGKGAFGNVRLAKIKVTDQVVAIKRMQKQKLVCKKQIASVFLQRECLAQSQSKWLVQLRSAFQDNQYLYIVMEWVPGGDLLRLLIEKDIFTEQQTKFYISELILAIEDMHKIHYIHRDIKPDNILIDANGHLKLTDFGLSKHVQPRLKLGNQASKQTNRQPRNSLKKLKPNRKRHFSKVGTPDYIAPEVLVENSYDHRVDIWSVGVIMFQCIFGYPPFSHQDSKQVCQKVINWQDHLIFPQTPKVSLQAKMLILGMLSPREYRLSISQIKSHAFFTGYNCKSTRENTPPFIPKLLHKFDVSYFDSFEDDLTWQQGEKNLFQQKRSNSSNYKYTFAGFDWQPRPQNNPFVQTIKQIKNIGLKRNSVSPKARRILTEQYQAFTSVPKNSRQFIKKSAKADERTFKQNSGLKKIKLKGKIQLKK